jgi:hypothetical protein
VSIRAKSASILEFVTLDSPDGRYDALYLWNYATINLVNELSRLPGVGNVTVMGAGEYSMRIWLDPQLLYSFNLVPEDVIRAVQQQSQEVTAGQVGMPPAPKDQAFQYTVDILSRFSDPNQFADLIVKDQTAQGGRLIRIKDVGRIEMGAQTYSQDFKLNGKPAAGIAIYQTPDANSLKVAAGVAAKMEELSRRFPAGLHYSIPYNTTIFIQDSINEVYKTLWQAGVLVLIVILVFLQNFRATLVPATTVPVTIIGAFAGMAALGYTVNLSTLFALILAIGIVVDDAIVIVEGVSKHIEQGVRTRRRDQGNGRAVRADHRHHAGADGGLFTVGLCARPQRADVCPIRLGDRGDGADQRGQRRDAQADAMRAVAAYTGAAGATEFLLSRLQPRLPGGGKRLHRSDRPDGTAERADGADRAGAVGCGHLGHRPSADRLYPERRPGLSAGRRTAAGRGCTRAHDRGTRSGGQDCSRHAGRRSGHRDFRTVSARQFRRPLQRRRQLCHAQAMGSAQ